MRQSTADFQMVGGDQQVVVAATAKTILEVVYSILYMPGDINFRGTFQSTIKAYNNMTHGTFGSITNKHFSNIQRP